MFVEKLNYEQLCQVAQKLKTPNMTRYNVHWHSTSPEIVVYDRVLGIFSVYLNDTCVFPKRYLGYDIEDANKILVKELYKIFGEEYKEFYLNQAKQIFEEE